MKWLEEVVDNALEKMIKEGVLMMRPDRNMPIEMIDSSIPTNNDWKGWKPIPSVLNDSDLNRLESIIGAKLPDSYRYFLMYKHFYELDIPDYTVNFHAHLPYKNLNRFNKTFFERFDPTYLIERGLIHFADFQDFGLLCFDSNKKRENNEYPIVFVDEGDLLITHHYSNSFKELMTADRETGNRFIMKLNDYYRKQNGR